MCFLISDFTSEAQLLGISDHFDHLHHLLSKPPSEKESNRQVQHPSDNIKIHRKEGVGRERGREREREKKISWSTPCHVGNYIIQAKQDINISFFITILKKI